MVQLSGGAERPKKKRSKKSDRPPTPTSLEGLPVLVIEDDPASLKLLDVVLSGEGCKVRLARSAEEGLDVLASFQPRVIILDLVLPLMSGVLLTHRLKQDPATADIVVIAVTAFNGPIAERVAFEAGCAAFVRKPIDPLSFTQLVSKHLGGTP